MSKKRRTVPYQYEPLVTPDGWKGDELRFSVRLTQLLDDLYQKYSALKTSQMAGATDEPTEEPSEPGLTMTEVISAIYPVGSVYLSVNNVSPAQLFGGTWEQIKDTFLLAAGDAYAAGTTGGESAHTLTETELPSHRHPSPQGTDASDYTYQLIRSLTTDATSRTQVATSTTSSVYALATKITAADSIGTSDLLTASNTGYIGGGQAHNNMPPYLAVYVWRRTA